MAKSKKPASKFEAVVEFKYGKGKKAPSVKVKAIVDFERIFAPSSFSLIQDLKNAAVDSALDITVRDTVLNEKDLKAAYKAWLKSSEG